MANKAVLSASPLLSSHGTTTHGPLWALFITPTKKNLKFFKILRYIQSLDTCMEY